MKIYLLPSSLVAAFQCCQANANPMKVWFACLTAIHAVIAWLENVNGIALCIADVDGIVVVIDVLSPLDCRTCTRSRFLPNKHR